MIRAPRKVKNAEIRKTIIEKIARLINVSIEDIIMNNSLYLYKDSQFFMVKTTGKLQTLYTRFGTNNWIYFGILE